MCKGGLLLLLLLVSLLLLSVRRDLAESGWRERVR